MDAYSPQFVRMWLRLHGTDFEEVPGPVGTCIGEIPEWFSRDAMELGWDGIFSAYGRSSGDGFPHDLRFLLDFGLAPDQPFLVHLETPHWYRSSYEYNEWDCEWTWDIIDRAPLAPEVAAQRWERALREEKEWLKAKAEREERHRFLARSQRDAMFISSCVYWGRGRYDEMSAPNALRLSLCSSVPWDGRKTAEKHHRRLVTMQLVSGCDEERGDHEVAMNELVKAALKELPGLDEAFIRKLPIQGDW